MVLLASLALALGFFRLAFAYNTTLVGILASEIVADFETASTCDDCLNMLAPIQQLANVGDDAFNEVWTELCTELGLGSAELCAGDLTEQGPILAYSLRAMDLSQTRTPTLFCLAIFGMCQYPAVLPHTVVLPSKSASTCAASSSQWPALTRASKRSVLGHRSGGCQNAEWDQCGGSRFDGSTCCPIGSTCEFFDEEYSQCLPSTDTVSSNSSSTVGNPSRTTETSTSTQISTTVSSSSSSAAPSPTTSRRPPVKWVHISDVHIDRYYVAGASTTCDFAICCRDFGPSSVTNFSSPAGPFGNIGCDAPVDLAQSMLDAIDEIVPDRVASLFTGDIVEGAVWMTNKSEVISDITAWNDMAIPIYPAIGNHDTSPVNSFPKSTTTTESADYQWIYDLSSEWARWIGSPAANRAIHNSGSYAIIHPGSNLKIISINTMFYYKQNFWLFDEDNPNWDPNGLLQWMADELQAAEDACQRVWIIGHIPFGKSDTMHDASNYADQIFQRYTDTIAAMFFGHSHKDQFEIGYTDWSNQTAETARGISFITGALTPTSGNPVFRVYEVDPDTFEVMDYKNYITNITSPTFQIKPEWELYYSARDHYGPLVGLADDEALDAPFWHKLTEVFAANDTAFQDWNTRQSRGGNVDACVGVCITTTICDMRASRSENNCDVASAGIAFNKRSLDSDSFQFGISDPSTLQESVASTRPSDDCNHGGAGYIFTNMLAGAAGGSGSLSAGLKRAQETFAKMAAGSA